MLELEKSKEVKTLGASSDAERRMANIRALVDDISRFYAEQSRESQGSLLWLREFLDRAALFSPTEDIPGEEQSKVTLLTGHLAKGLEFPVVFVIGMNEGSFPHFRSVDTEEDVQEERRLVYVALTRAQKKLYLTRPRKQQKREGGGVRWIPAKPSRFISEIPGHLFTSTVSSSSPASKRRFISRRTSSASTSKEPIRSPLPKDNPQDSYYTRTPDSVSDFQKGVWVTHSKFGRGKIIRKTGSAHDPKLQVFFDSFGMRNLVARFAPLEIIVYD
jgi:DNA helicase-2/ATP-dependent DNA helicase PcrA